MLKVSVIIPTYNHAEFLAEAIDSVFSSKLVDVELIVVDDGSTDSTSEVVSKYPNVKSVFQLNSGAHAAINHGISLAKHDYIAILNDDDIFLSNHLYDGVTNLSSFGNQLFIGFCEPFGKGPKLDVMKQHVVAANQAIDSVGYLSSLLKLNWATSTSAYIFHRDLLSYTGEFQPFQMCHDLDFLLTVLKLSGASIAVSKDPSWRYRCHEYNSGSLIKLLRQNAEISFSLGKFLENSGMSLDEKLDAIGYGIPKSQLQSALTMKPWNCASSFHDSALAEWINYCEGANSAS